MERVNKERVVDGGFEGVRVENGLVSMVLIPALGGKLSSLRDLRTGREWLWRNPRAGFRAHAYGASYVRDANEGGWDECFPTVAECEYPLSPWRGVKVPDHGEIWSQPWNLSITRSKDGALSLCTAAAGQQFPYRFERTISLRPASSTFRLDYTLTSYADRNMAFIWSAHPLFSIEPGMRVEVPHDAAFNTFSSLPADAIPTTKAFSWPPEIHSGDRQVNLLELPVGLQLPEGFAFKIWSMALSIGQAALYTADGKLEFAFDPRSVPQLGIWLNIGGWAGDGGEPFEHLAIEPCIGAQDSLQEAVEKFDTYAVLPAGATREWWLEVSLDTAFPKPL